MLLGNEFDTDLLQRALADVTVLQRIAVRRLTHLCNSEHTPSQSTRCFPTAPNDNKRIDMAEYKGGAGDATRTRQLAKQREEQLNQLNSAKAKIAADAALPSLHDVSSRFDVKRDATDNELVNATVGYKTRDEFLQTSAAIQQTAADKAAAAASDARAKAEAAAENCAQACACA
jgi:hypothetical protein